MRRLLSKFYGTGNKWTFHRADLSENTEALKNPARGWYRIFPFWAQEDVDTAVLSKNCKADADTLALVIINIGAYRENAIDEHGIQNIRGILRFFASCEYDIILRIVYDHEGKALEREPFFFEQVKEHIGQLFPILKEFALNIFVFQGLLVGNWGEMHTSRFLTPVRMLEMWKLFQPLEKEIYFAVRKPLQWRQLHRKESDKQDFLHTGMGLFDDAIFGSDSHLGTFGLESKPNADWEELWSREDELAFEEKLCVYAPNGGEALCGEQYLHEGALEETIAVLNQMHITYLNRQYDRLILNTWKEWIWTKSDRWQGKSIFEYIGAHLGYRFWVKDVILKKSGTISNELNVTIHVQNIGFANIYQEAEVYLICKEESGYQYERKLDTDMRRWNSGSTQVLKTNIRLLPCCLYLTARRKRDGRCIYFANMYQQDELLYLGNVEL